MREIEEGVMTIHHKGTSGMTIGEGTMMTIGEEVMIDVIEIEDDVALHVEDVMRHG